MAHRVWSALAWGAAGLLLVGVLVQGAVLLGLDIDASLGAVATVVVTSDVAVASAAYVIEPRLERKGRA